MQNLVIKYCYNTVNIRSSGHTFDKNVRLEVVSCSDGTVSQQKFWLRFSVRSFGYVLFIVDKLKAEAGYMNLTKPQKLIYDMEKFAGGAISVICGSMLCRGKRDVDTLAVAVNTLYRINDALRIRISETDGVSEQTITPYHEREIKVLHFETKAELDSYAQKYATEPVDMFGELCEIKIVLLPEQYGILVKLHHIIGDAWSLSLLGNQFNAILNGETPEAYSYADYVTAENEYFESKRYGKDKAFFLEQFSKCDEVTYLSEKQSKTYTANRKTFVIGKDKTAEIIRYAETREITAFTLFTAALSTYMNRAKMNAEKFYIGTAVLNRTTAKEKQTVGMFINTVPMLMELNNDNTFAENLATIQDGAFSIFRHQKYNYGDMLSTLRAEHNFGEKLYDVMLSYQNATVEGDCEEDLSGKKITKTTENFDQLGINAVPLPKKAKPEYLPSVYRMLQALDGEQAVTFKSIKEKNTNSVKKSLEKVYLDVGAKEQILTLPMYIGFLLTEI